MIPVTKSSARFAPDPTRVIVKPFTHGAPTSVEGCHRVRRIVSRIQALSDSETTKALMVTYERFEGRHRDLRGTLEANYTMISGLIADANELSPERRLLIGAYFS